MAAPRMRFINRTRQSELAARAELADTPGTRGKGLLGRNGLEPGGGLWIVPGWLPVGPIHMCGMRFAIDAVFLSRDHRVTGVCEAIQPQPRWALWRIWSGGRGTHSVLELPVGAIAGSATAVGDQIEIEKVTP